MNEKQWILQYLVDISKEISALIANVLFDQRKCPNIGFPRWYLEKSLFPIRSDLCIPRVFEHATTLSDKCKRSVIWRINLCVSTLHLPFCGRSRAWLLRCSCGESSTRVEADDRRSWVVRPLPAAAAPRAPALAPAALDQHRLDHRTWCARVFATAWVRRVMPFSWNHVRKNPVKIRVYPKLPRYTRKTRVK